ncbi:uncharacterized protein LOC113509934 isoform X2 [Galleria mellonella]|uniref:Uncharacterized protein LOC113509934 isoform X2 n=1 Tax=Galleria mellonella TaxID=7137 RepID=A0A6J1WF79_GALME|nr:uncharacterized protein LOC113509934 isoform X2 [Galleria mellonella]
MSLTKILRVPIKLFKKDVITFLIVRRHDLAVEEKLRYIVVKPTASISMLRQKIWHLLDLPDYCEEIVILKRGNDVEIALTELRKGNDPQHPYLLEVWLPASRLVSSKTLHKNMLTMGENEHVDKHVISTINTADDQEIIGNRVNENPTISTDTKNLRFTDNKITYLYSDYKKSDLSCRISSNSLFKLHKNKNRDSFTNILLKIQSDLSTLSNKLSNLENRI